MQNAWSDPSVGRVKVLVVGLCPGFIAVLQELCQNHWRETRGKETGLSTSRKHELGGKIAGFPWRGKGLTVQRDGEAGSPGLREVGQGGRDLCCHNAG